MMILIIRKKNQPLSDSSKEKKYVGFTAGSSVYITTQFEAILGWLSKKKVVETPWVFILS